jgi:hypothetical protein
MLALWQDYFAQNPAVAASGIGVVSLAAFYGVAWFLYGRDPPHGTIVPLFAAPDGLSAEAVRLIHAMRWDRKAFSAALISCAVKGYLLIREEAGQYTLERTGTAPEACGLTPGEIAMGAALFAGKRRSLELQPYNSKVVQDGIGALEDALFKEADRYFTQNDTLFWSGAGIFALTGVAAIWFSEDPLGEIVDVVFLAVTLTVTVSWLVAWWGQWRDLLRKPSFGQFLWAVLTTLLIVPISLLALAMVNGFGLTISYSVFGPMLLGGGLLWLFRGLLKVPTALGGVTRDRIDGLKMYLQTAEKDRLEAITPQVFEKFLPYAVALDCETSWTRAFEARVVPDAPDVRYTPGWYLGTMAALDTVALFSDLGSGLGGAAAAAAIAPSAPSSASSGMSIGGAVVSGLIGGFSGGGRGGGGGGGW